MEPERWHRVEELYNAAIELAVDERMLFLKDACRDDPALYKELESLLSYEERAAQFIDRPAFEVVAELMAEDKARLLEPDKRVGKAISHFRVLEKLGQGGMGIVFRAEDIHLGRQVALKFVPEETKDSQAFQRLQREARAASSLNHPNICAIHEIGEHEAEFFIAMELLEGQSLDRRIGGQPLPTAEMLTLGVQITEGLHAAHQKGIIHRDIKPANIFVTSEGQAKILDFGLAKVAAPVMVIGADSEWDHRDEGVQGTPHEIKRLPTPDHSLSRTGVAMGTAGYMSPEQARGEKLDARTDLFSLGLVLYEMATGKRAFSGDTGPELHDAILKHPPAPARQFNPKLPPRLEAIIHKALEKEREARYQTASELRTDLQLLKLEIEPKSRTVRQAVAVGVVAAVLITGAGLWYLNRKILKPAAVHVLKLRQLTINSGENGVNGGAISPDGKYLAYADQKGMHLRIMETGETRSILQPDDFKNVNVDWEVLASGWFPDSSRFLVNAHMPKGDANSPSPSIWMVSGKDTVPNKLRDNAAAYSVSPDGSLISFGANNGRFGPREIWLMRSNGEQARRLFETDENSSIGGLLWAPDGQRVIYVRSDESGDSFVNRALNEGPVTTLFTPPETKDMTDALWLRDGRLIYSLRETETVTETCNYWMIRVDARSGERIGKPERLTNLTGLCMNSSSATSDGKRLVFQGFSAHTTVYTAALAAGGTRIFNPQHFTLDESANYAQGWTPDSKTLLFTSNRAGNTAIYKQALNEDTPELVAGGPVGFRQARVSPDGKWIMAYLAPKPGGPSDPEQLMRLPISGGSPELIFTSSPESGISCALPGRNLCVVVEASADHKQCVVTAFDLVKGRGRELARVDIDQNQHQWYCEISPDGTRLAVSASPEGPIRVMSLRGDRMKVVPLTGLKINTDLFWAADGNGFYFDTVRKRETVLLHLDLRGHTHVLWENRGGNYALGIPSPDGRHIAVAGNSVISNMWTIENF